MRMTWEMPPDWPVQEVVVLTSARRTIVLRYSASQGLELRVPCGVEDARLREFLHSKREWVMRQVQRQAERSSRFPAPMPGELLWRGSSLNIVAVPWLRRAERRGGELLLNPDRMAPQLHAWLAEDLKRRIEQFVSDVEPFGLVPTSIQVRRMRSRWGSCSRGGGMRFNAALAHLDDRCVHYVVCHELAHLVHFNHSQAFYQVLDQILPTHLDDERHLRLHENVLLHGGYTLPTENKKAGNSRLS